MEIEVRYTMATQGGKDIAAMNLNRQDSFKAMTALPQLPTTLPFIGNKSEVSEGLDGMANYTNALNAIGVAMNSMSGAVNEGAGAWFNWIASVSSSIATAVPLIAGLTAAKKAEATANAEAAVTGAASSVASIPVVGWVLALGAVAGLVGAFASIPKFASGGIIAGGYTSGDMNLARVNAGEMILNKSQQANLFNLLDGKASMNNGGGYPSSIRLVAKGDRKSVV